MYQPRKNTSKDDIMEEQQSFDMKDLDTGTVEEKKKILDYLNRTSASFLAEISWETGITEYTARSILAILKKEKLIENVPVDMYVPDLRLRIRVPDQSAIGQGGYANFSKKRWVSITKKGEEWLHGRNQY